MSELRIGELAKTCGVSPDTIRHYEKMGLLRSVMRTGNGYRLYADADLRRVFLIRNALALGFTLRELAEILKSRDTGRPPCLSVREAAVEKLAAIDARIIEMKTLRRQLQEVVNDWNEKLEQSGPDGPAHLLESLIDRRRKS